MLHSMHMRIWNSMRVQISYLKLNAGHFDRNEISFWVIKYHVNTTRNEMPTRVHQNIGLFWNAAEMKLHVNRTCFHAGLKSQTGTSSFRFSCERTLTRFVLSDILGVPQPWGTWFSPFRQVRYENLWNTSEIMQ